MNRVQPEHVHSKIFTPQEYQVELIDSCLQQNTIAVLASKSTRAFLITMVTRELSHQTRRKKNKLDDNLKHSGLELHTLIIGKSGPKLVRAGEAIQQNTNLSVATYTSLEQVEDWIPTKWSKIFLDSQVLVMTVDVLEIGIETKLIPFDLLNLLVITDAHQLVSSDLLNKILFSLNSTCRILGMTSPILSHSLSPPELDSLLRYLKTTTFCEINTSSEIVTILRYIHKPEERVIICASPFLALRPDPESEVRQLTAQALNFLGDHRYDLVEVYGQEYAEFCIGVPDPVKEPKQILIEFLYILDNLGLWCADRAALYSLVEIEKLKKKTAYDRHYLLLCLIFSVLARIRAVIEDAFENHSELNQMLNFSTPKVLRMIDVLRQIRPVNFVDPRKRKEKLDNVNELEANKTNPDIANTNDKEFPELQPYCSNCSCYSSLKNDACIALQKNVLLNNEGDRCSSSMCSFYDTNGVEEDEDGCESKSTSINNEHCANYTLPTTCNGCMDKGDTSITLVPESVCPLIGNLSLNDENNDFKGTGCDYVQNMKKETASTSLCNGNTFDSECKLNEFKSTYTTDIVSVPSTDLLPPDSIRSDSSLSDMSTSSYAEMISCNSNFSGNAVVKSCICPCHSSFSSRAFQDNSEKSITNGCVFNEQNFITSSDNSYKTETSNEPKHLGLTCDQNVKMNFKEVKVLKLNPDNNDDLNCDKNIVCNLPENYKAHLKVTNSFESEDDLLPLKQIKNQTSECSDVTIQAAASTNNCILEVKPQALLAAPPNIISAANEGEEPSTFSETAITSVNAKLIENSELTNTNTSSQLLPSVGGRTKRKREDVKGKVKVHNPDDPESVCALVFVNHRTTAKIVYRLLKELSDIGGDFGWLFPQYTVELCKNASEDPRAAEAEHKKQEEVLRRFRHHECNILVSTAVLEAGIDVPQCNLVIRFDPAINYPSYVHSRGRAKGQNTFYFHLIVKEEEEKVISDIASYKSYESVLLSQCGRVDKGTDIEVSVSEANNYFPAYVTSTGATITMSSSINLLNKYCAKLPSDTFTRLTAMWEMESKSKNCEEDEFSCTIMLPINSPLKGFIKGPRMQNISLAKMSAALKVCQRLHEIGELDDNLLPVGKESMQLDDHLCAPLPDDIVPEGMPRPGTTKRRQYYYKKIAECFIGKEPMPSMDLYIYKLDMVLSCPIPDDQNTRGRKIYRPELSSRSLGLVTTKPIPHVSGFPVFTRSGEVMVKLVSVCTETRIQAGQIKGLENFHQFTFTHVLRLEKYPIMFHPDNSRSTFYIAPLIKGNGMEGIDWDFVKLIESNGDQKPSPPSEEIRKKFTFDQSRYVDAVVMPWYRNQEQPQYFYVAEICSHLNPQSDFPDAGFESFEKYYSTKYDIDICNLKQPLLDVDHTSGRLNLLTPRHVNRKGVALPTTSEETKKAKRENLQQKQILVPELCTIHPFPASLWRKAVCLPTILYRINGLLLANELRVSVAEEIGLGLTNLPADFTWPPLDFGWSLADVLAKSSEANKETADKKKEDKKGTNKTSKEENETNKSKKSDSKECASESSSKANGSEMEIGTWSNDMALFHDSQIDNELDYEIESFDPNVDLPDNLTLLDYPSGDDVEGELGADWGTGIPERKARKKKKTGGGELVRVGSPSNFENDGWDTFGAGSHVFNPYDSANYNDMYDDYYDYGDDYEGDESEQDEEDKKEDIEWEEQNKRRTDADKESLSDEDDEEDWPKEHVEPREEIKVYFQGQTEKNKAQIMKSNCYVGENDPIVIIKPCRTINNDTKCSENIEYLKKDISVGVEEKVIADNIQIETQPNIDCNLQLSLVPELKLSVNREATLAQVKKATECLPCHKKEVPEPVFSFDNQPDLETHAGPSPSIILQALTMSNANDGVNLERLETIGDSYLKYAITNYLYCTYTHKHEGKLSYLRSKQVSNLNLYRLGKRKRLGEFMVATKFEPHDNWLPPGYFVPRELEEALIDSGVPAGHWNMADFPGLHDLGSEEIRKLVHERSEQIKLNNAEQLASELISVPNPQDLPIFIPYNLLTQHSIPDKSIADCVEALIGAYLTTCGPKGALLFMTWLGIKVLPNIVEETPDSPVITYLQLPPPNSPLDTCPLPNAEEQLHLLLSGYEEFEEKIGYVFRDRSYLLQAFTHASYYRNRLTDCYQRLEFLGDAVLDYLITRHLFEDKRQHSPGALTDLRSALVNNTIFATLAVKYEFHKYFRHFSPGLDRVVRDFVRMQEENGHKVNEEYYFMEEDECEAAEDIEVPKALGDVFESVAGAILLDSGGSLDAVWRVYYFMMKSEIEQFSGVVPKSPIRELLEMEPETAKFGKPERLVDGKVRVSVEIFGKGSFSGVGRNYRIAKSTAAKRALRHLKKLQMMMQNDNSSNFA